MPSSGQTYAAAYAYAYYHEPNNVRFYKSVRYTATQLEEYLGCVATHAARSGVELLEIIVWDGDHEIYRK